MRTASWLTALVTGSLLGLLAACPTDDGTDGAMLDGGTGGTAGGVGLNCEPGEMLPCTCANGASGDQACLDDGHSVGGCACDPLPDPTAASTTLPPNVDGGAEGTGDESSSGGSAGESSATGDAGTATSDGGPGTDTGATSTSGAGDNGEDAGDRSESD